MKTILLLIVYLLATCTACGTNANVLPPNQTLYNVSFGMYVASRSADMLTTFIACKSPQVYEANPLVWGTSNGKFTVKTLAAHTSVMVVYVITQRYVVRKWPGSKRVLTVVNMSLSACHTYATIHNLHLVRTPTNP